MLTSEIATTRTAICAIGLFALSATLVTAVMWLWRAKNRRKGFNNKTRLQLLPKSRAGIWETIRALGGPRAPFFALEQVRDLDGARNFRLNLPPLFLPSFVIAGGYELQRELLKDCDKPYEILKTFEFSIGGPSLFTMNNARARPVRRKFHRAFAPSEIKHMHGVCMEIVDKWVAESLNSLVDDDRAFDPAQECLDLTFFVICKVAFEYEATREEARRIISLGKLASKEFAFRQISHPWRKYCTWFLPERRRALRCLEEVKEFTRKILRAYREKPNKRPNTVISIIENDMGYNTDDEKLPEIKLWLMAGHDTTGYSLSTALWHLAQHPVEQKKIRDSLRGVPKEKWAALNAVQHAIKESNRLVPPAAMATLRKTHKDIVTKQGHFLPSGSVVMMSQYISNRDPAVYAPDPDEFRPSRWDTGEGGDDDDATRAAATMKMAHMPFVIGPRRCPGQSLAEAELFNVLPRLLSEFEWTVEERGRLTFFVTLKNEGVRLRAKRVTPIAASPSNKEATASL